jgi:hypothetical protein
MISTTATARLAILATLALFGFVACTSAQRTAPLNNNPPQKDPNLPPLTGNNDAPLYWSYGSDTVPHVEFRGYPYSKDPTNSSEAAYDGFNENGSLIYDAGNRKLYYWKLTNAPAMMGTLTPAYSSPEEVPLEVLAALLNPSSGIKSKLAMNAPTGPVSKALLADPNFPALTYMNEGPVYWSYGTSSIPKVGFKLPSADAEYLGFNEKGSLLQNKAFGKVYYWKISNPVNAAGTLTLAFNTITDIPAAELQSLKNPGPSMVYMLRNKGVAAPPPPISPKASAAFGDNPQKALQGLAPTPSSSQTNSPAPAPTQSPASTSMPAPASGPDPGHPTASPYDITGKDASIKAGILTFTLPDGSKSKPYTVTRPGFMANSPQAPAGISGTWICPTTGGKGIMFTITADNSVTAKEISPQVLQMLMQAAPKPK